MLAVALLTLAIAGAPQTAVVDLSAPPSAALAQALRELPGLQGLALSAQQTALIVDDAAGLGLRCAFDDDGCLQKLVVLGRIDELIALDATAEEVRLARVTARELQRAVARVAGSPAARARAAWGALRRVVEAPRAAEGADQASAGERFDEGARRARGPVADERGETPTASSGGVTVPLVVGMSGAGAALVFGAGAVGVSAALAQQLRGTQRGIPLDDSYDALQLAFWSLSTLTVVSAGTGAVGLWLFLADEPDAVSEP